MCFCSEPVQRKPQRGAAEGRPLFVGSFVLALNKSTCPSSQRSTCPAPQQGRCLGSQQSTCRLASQHSDMPSVQSQRKGGGLRPSPQREAAFGRPPLWFPLGWLCTLGNLIVETQDMCLVESQDICLVETQDMCCVES